MGQPVLPLEHTSVRKLVSIDIETTGFDPQKDDVIELAAVRYEDGHITERLEVLVKPSKPIPSAIEVITGISDEMVQDAQSLTEVQKEFEEFIEGYVLIGHNVAFDIGFLQGKGFTLPDTAFDTWKLATVLLPHESSHSLEILTKRLELSHSSKHRAGDDAEAVVHLLEHLLTVARTIPKEVLKEAVQIGEANAWPMAPLLAEVLEENSGQSGAEPHLDEPVSVKTTIVPPGTLEESLRALGRGQGEIDIATHAQKALEKGGSYMYETGAGTRRLSGVVLPLLRASSKGQRTLLLLPSSRALQEALEGPVAEVQSAVEGVSIATLDDQSSYICSARLAQWKTRADLTGDEVNVLLRIVLWQHELQDNRFVEIGLTGFEGRSEHGLSAEAATCGSEEHQKLHQACSWNQAIQKAAAAECVLATHSLFVEDARELIEPFSAVVVEEADGLYRFLTTRLTHRWDAERARRLITQADELLEEKSGLMEKIDLFFGLVGGEAEHQRDPGDESPMWSVRLDGVIIHSGTFWKVEKAAINLAEELERLRVNIVEKDVRGVSYELALLSDFLKSMFSREAQQDATREQGSTFIRWIEIREQESVAIVRAPIATDGLLFAGMWEQRDTIVVLGDILFEHRGEGTYLRDVLGLPFETRLSEVPSALPYPSVADIFIANDVQEPGKPGYTKALADYAREISSTLKGRTVVLTTSGAGVKAVHREIALPLKQEGIDVLGQRVTGGKMKIQEIFSEEGRPTTLIGGMALWTGLKKLPEGSVRCVLLSKFPFDAPVKPLVAARSEQYGNGFAEYSLPEALLTFRQGVYQFLGSEKHPVTFVLLDSRTTSRSYGNDFLTALPLVGVTEGGREDLIAQLGTKDVEK